MTDRNDLPRIKPTEKPTLLNGEAAGWGIAGAFVGGAVAGITRFITKNETLGNAAGYATQAVSIAFGAFKGKARMEREAVDGKVVKQPSHWNRGLINGWFAAEIVSLPTQFLLRNASIPLRLAVAAGTLVVGLVGGSIIRKNSMQRDYDQALQVQAAQKDLGAARQTINDLAAPTSYKNSVTLEESAALAEKQSRPKEHAPQSHASKMAAPAETAIA